MIAGANGAEDAVEADPLDAELAALNKELELLEAEQQRKAKEREIEEKRLVVRLTKELGPKGVRWDLVKTSEGPFAVKLGPSVLYKALAAKLDSGEATDEEIHGFVKAQLAHPAEERALEVLGAHRALWNVLGTKIVALHHAAEVARAKK